MTKSDYIREVSKKANVAQRVVKKMLDAMQEVLYEELKKGEEVKIFDSISILAKDVPERTARNPQTGELIVVPRHFAPKAKFGQNIKNCLKNC